MAANHFRVRNKPVVLIKLSFSTRLLQLLLLLLFGSTQLLPSSALQLHSTSPNSAMHRYLTTRCAGRIASLCSGHRISSSRFIRLFGASSSVSYSFIPRHNYTISNTNNTSASTTFTTTSIAAAGESLTPNSNNSSSNSSQLRAFSGSARKRLQRKQQKKQTKKQHKQYEMQQQQFPLIQQQQQQQQQPLLQRPMGLTTEGLQMLRFVKARRCDEALQMYDQLLLQQQNTTLRPSVLTALLSCCNKKQHLPRALQLVAAIDAAGFEAGREACSIALIRCYADNDSTETALLLASQLIAAGVEPKLRIYQPILEALCRRFDAPGALRVVALLRQHGLLLRAEQLTAMIDMLGKASLAHKQQQQQQQQEQQQEPLVAFDLQLMSRELDALLAESAESLLGFSTEEIQQIVAVMNNSSAAEVAAEGILVQSLADIHGPVVDRSSIDRDGSVLALNATYGPVTMQQLRHSPNWISNDPFIPIGQDNSSVSFSTERYLVVDPFEDIDDAAVAAMDVASNAAVLSETSSTVVSNSGSVSSISSNSSSNSNSNSIGKVPFLSPFSVPEIVRNPDLRYQQQLLQQQIQQQIMQHQITQQEQHIVERLAIEYPDISSSSNSVTTTTETIAETTSDSVATTAATADANRRWKVAGRQFALSGRIHRSSNNNSSNSNIGSNNSSSNSNINNSSSSSSNNNGINSVSRLRSLPPLSAAVKRNQSARVVEISARSCRCPNCGGNVLPILISAQEKAQVRAAIEENVAAHSVNQSANLQNFTAWLRSQKEEFEYIVDGANVAYLHQNFEAGKFSFKQIELVVNKLKERTDRILVIIPHAYTQKYIPNSVRARLTSSSSNSNNNGDSGSSSDSSGSTESNSMSSGGDGGSSRSRRSRSRSQLLSKEDQRILNTLEEEGRLFVVPRGANDDWYWMYSTLYEGRRSPAYVVTNDLMRDHKIAFMHPRPFVRWRTSQIVYFGLSKASEAGDTVVPEVYFYGPSKFSREIQQSPSNQRWHIPSIDRSLWLCLDTQQQQ